jgi:hypothetical protein
MEEAKMDCDHVSVRASIMTRNPTYPAANLFIEPGSMT